MVGQTRQQSETRCQENPELQRQQKVKNLQATSHRNLTEILLYILISIAAYQFTKINLLATFPEPIRDFLGYPVPAYLLSIALAGYYFAAMVSALNQITKHLEPAPSWTRLGYRSAFYLFYALSGVLENHFMAIFFICFFLYGVEQGQIWIYGSQLEQQVEDLLGEGQLDK